MRTFKRILAIVMCAVMTLTAAPFVGFESPISPKAHAKLISKYAVGDIIEFGSYPQSQITDSELISALDKLQLNWTSYSYYSGTNEYADGQMKSGDWMKYADVVYENTKYRAVKLTQYRPYCTHNINSADLSRQDNYGFYINVVYWFKFEPLKWRLLDPAEGLILCEQVIDNQAFSNIVYCDRDSFVSGDLGYKYYNNTNCKHFANDYKTSSIRTWLNYDLYNIAFTEEEKAQIKPTILSETVTDNVFLISYEDVRNTKLGFSNSDSASSTRCAKATTYAKCQGVYTYSKTGNSIWWLNTKGNSDDLATNYDLIYSVPNDGEIQSNSVVSNCYGVRPALKLSSDSDIFDPSSEHQHYPGTLQPNMGNETLYAYWKANTLIVYFNANGGKVSSGNHKIISNKIYYSDSSECYETWTYNNSRANGLTNAKTFGLTKEGYTFVGWGTSSGGTIFDQNNTALVPTDITSKINNGNCEITLYAIWQKNTYTLTYNANGGSGTPSSQNGATSYTISSVKPTRSGYTFLGWATSSNATTASYVGGSNITLNANTTLYAVWQKKSIDFPEIKIKRASTSVINYGDTLVLHLEEIEVPEGYAIAWFVEGTGVSTWVSEDGLECRVTSVANGNPTIFAKLVDEEENVVTNADGEEIFDEITLTSKAGFWQKFVSFFKNLFGISRIILQSV